MKVTYRICLLPAKIFVLFHLASVRSLDYGQSCKTPLEELGECVTIRACPKFAHLSQSPIEVDIPYETFNILKRSWCGLWKDYPLICCPYKAETSSTVSTSVSADYGENCRTPERNRGTCIRVKECPRFAHLVEKESIPQTTVAILKQSYCGKINKTPLICCPSDSTISPTSSTSTTTVSTTVAYKGPCWTPNAVRGKCIKAHLCPQFSEALIRHPESDAVQEALNESFCGMRGNHKLVCCPDNDTVIHTTTTESVIEAIEVGFNCQTSMGETGTCMSEKDCRIHHEGTLPNHAQLASSSKSSCRVKDGQRLICCPPVSKHYESEARCQTPTGEDGKCISLNECPALSSLVNPKLLTKYNLEQLQKSHCGPLNDDNLYCCPSSGREDTIDLKQHQNLYLLDQNICGKSPLFRAVENQTEIGKKAQLSTIPWMALIAYTSDTTSSFRCVGSIINRRYILTAARCVSNLSQDVQPVSVRLGEHNLEYALDCTDKICAPAPQNIYIEEIVPHPGYIGSSSYLNDIAIIRLAKEISFGTGSVQPICLPIEKSLHTKDYTNKRLLVSGWFTSKDEYSHELLQDVVRGVSHKVCSENYENKINISYNSHICVYNGRGDDCLGKGASPLVSFEEFHGRKAAVQQGIGLFGPSNCYRITQPVVYTRIGKFMKWVLDNLRP